MTVMTRASVLAAVSSETSPCRPTVRPMDCDLALQGLADGDGGQFDRLAFGDGCDAVLIDLDLGHHVVGVAHVHDAGGRRALAGAGVDVKNDAGDRRAEPRRASDLPAPAPDPLPPHRGCGRRR